MNEQGALTMIPVIAGRISRAAAALACLLMGSVVLILNHMIVIRLMGQPVVWHVELGIYLTIAGFFLGIPYVVLTRGDVAVDLVSNSLSQQARRWFRIVVHVVVLFTGVYLAWSSGERTLEAFHSDLRSTSLWGPRLWPVYACMPLGFGLTCLQLVAEIIAGLTRQPGYQP
jgi:TRAP-type C4-dicarboxylate transport system permease small subunit